MKKTKATMKTKQKPNIEARLNKTIADKYYENKSALTKYYEDKTKTKKTEVVNLVIIAVKTKQKPKQQRGKTKYILIL